MVQTLSSGHRKGRKAHQCFECYREIPAKTTHHYQTNVYDGRVYTLRSHSDCAECAREYNHMTDQYFDEGYQPLRDAWCAGDYKLELDYWRGFYPNVVARMELTDQLREARK